MGRVSLTGHTHTLDYTLLHHVMAHMNSCAHEQYSVTMGFNQNLLFQRKS